MIENLIENENYKYEIYDKYICEQNIDRIKFYKNDLKNPKINLLSAGYHLDKNTQKKTGGVFFFNIDEQKQKLIPLNNENILLDYGILDIKFSKNNLIFTANSDYSYTIFDLINNSINKNYLYTTEEKEQKNNITNDILEVDNSEQKIFFGTNDGNIIINDLKTQKNILTFNKAHDYGIWSINLLENNENIFLTGGEDAKIKLWDLRSKNNNKEERINDKSYQSSINYIDLLKFDLSKNVLITGSYDEKIIFFDLRNFPKELKSIKTEHSSWDMKQTTLGNKNILLISSIYEGFNIWEIDNEKDLEMKHVLRLPLTKEKDIFHKSIVYGVDIKQNIDKEKNKCVNILSCSFYDNLMMYWNYSLV